MSIVKVKKNNKNFLKKLATKTSFFLLPAKDLLRLILVHGLLSEFCQLILEPGTAIHELLSVQVEIHRD